MMIERNYWNLSLEENWTEFLLPALRCLIGQRSWIPFYNWQTFRFIVLSVENDKVTRSWSIDFALLGLGASLRIFWDDKATREAAWKADWDALMKEEEEENAGK